MTNKAIQPCALLPSTDSYREDFHTLAIPRPARTELLGLRRSTAKGDPDKIKEVPTRGFRGLLRAVAPELIVMSNDITPDNSDPTLYSKTPFSPQVLSSLINTWAIDLARGSTENITVVRDTLERIRPQDLVWRQESVDLLEQHTTEAGTCVPAAPVYRLLPEILARRVAAHTPFEIEGVQLSFVQGPASDRGAAQLVSWPPREHVTGRGAKKRIWHYSIYLTLSVQTLPFDPKPRIHVHCGIRRWVTGQKVWLVPGDKASVYLAADAPWLAEAPSGQPRRFALGRIDRDTSLRVHRWSAGGPEEMLRRLTFNRKFPNPNALVEDPTPWLDGQDGVTAAVLFSTAMRFHGVEAGLMPADRAPLFHWVAQALAPHFQPVPEYIRSESRTTPLNPPLKKRSKPNATTEEKATLEAEHQQALARVAAARRPRLAEVRGEPHLMIDLLYQHDMMRAALIAAAVKELDLQNVQPTITVDSGRIENRTWQTPELEVTLRSRPLGAIGDALSIDGKSPAGRAQWDAAVAERRTAVAQHAAGFGPGGALVLAEIGREGSFGGSSCDPKIALRLGFSDAHLVSQFINPPVTLTEETGAEDPGATAEAEAAFRARAAFLDGLRQMGLNTLAEHSLCEEIPADLQYIAFWIIRKNRSGATRHGHYLPVAVLMRPGRPEVLAAMPGRTEWVPYAELLQRIGQEGTEPGGWSRVAKRATTAQFVRWLLQEALSRPTLLLTHAQNGRDSWPWLTNSVTEPDKIRIGDGRVQALRLYRGLRHVRVRGSESYETAQWFAFNHRTGRPGLSEGLWVPPGADRDTRVFGSTTAKPDTAQKVAVSASVLVPGPQGRTAAGQLAWNPGLLEIAVLGCQPGDEPESWAALTHQLRITPDHRSALGLPLPLHLARQIAEYVLHTSDSEE